MNIKPGFKDRRIKNFEKDYVIGQEKYR